MIDDIILNPLFLGIDRMEVLSLLGSAHERNLLVGEYYFLQGDPAERMYILVQGRVKLAQSGQYGKQALIQIIKPIHLFGLVAMTWTNYYPVSAQTISESLALYWTHDELMEYVMKVPQLALNALRIMADQLQELQDRFLQVTTQRVEQRLAHTLIRLAAQSGRRVEEGILIDHPLTRQDLAEMSGTTLYTASRTLSLWEKQELVKPGREKVIIRNPNGLANIIEGESA